MMQENSMLTMAYILATILFIVFFRRSFEGGLGWIEKSIGGLVLALMLMGLVLSFSGVHRRPLLRLRRSGGEQPKKEGRDQEGRRADMKAIADAEVAANVPLAERTVIWETSTSN